MPIPDKTLERLSIYRRLLALARLGDDDMVFSHELADMASGNAAQVRRDLMELGVAGHRKLGYRVGHLNTEIGRVLDPPNGTGVVVLGVGNLGRALLQHIGGEHERLHVVGVFDTDPSKIGHIIHGYRCDSINDLEAAVQARGADVAIITTPAEAAQAVCDRLIAAGIRGILNFAPTPLQVPDNVFVEQVDIETALEKIACVARGAPARNGMLLHEGVVYRAQRMQGGAN